MYNFSMHFISTVSLVAISLFAGHAVADSETLTIGTDATYLPFESLDASGKFQGFDIDIGNALCN